MRSQISRIFSTWPLRVSIPVAILLFTGVMAGGAYFLNVRVAEGQLERDAVANLTAHLTELQGSFERYFAANMFEQVQQELAEERVDPALRIAFVSDERQRIIASTRREYIGRPQAERLADLDLPWPGLDLDALMTTVRSRRVGQVLLSPKRDAVLAVFPVTLGVVAGQVRGGSIGTIFFGQDLTPDKARARREVARTVGVFALTRAAIAGLFFILLHHFVVRRVAGVVATARRFTAGERQARARLQGGDEIAELGGVFDAMADAVNATQDRLRASEDNLAITLNSIGDAVIATDAAGRITRMNPTAERLTGWMLAEAAERPLTEVFRIVDAQTRRPVTDPVQLVLERGKVVSLADHTALLARDGREFPTFGTTAPIRNAAGELVGVVLVFSDVTDKFQMTEALDAARKRLTFALLRSGIGAWELDLTTHSAHRTLLHDQIFGYERMLPVWNYEMFLEHVLPEDRAEVERTFHAATTTRTDWTFECRIRRADGAERWIRASGGHEHGDGGEPVRLSGIVQDITEHKLAERAIQDQLQELQRWHAVILKRESRTLKLKHEINQLLAAGGQPARYPSAEPTDEAGE